MNQENKKSSIDGYGKPFDPEKHAEYVRLGVWKQSRIVFIDPCGTGVIDPNPVMKDKPAGHFEKGSGV